VAGAATAGPALLREQRVPRLQDHDEGYVDPAAAVLSLRRLAGARGGHLRQGGGVQPLLLLLPLPLGKLLSPLLCWAAIPVHSRGPSRLLEQARQPRVVVSHHRVEVGEAAGEGGRQRGTRQLQSTRTRTGDSSSNLGDSAVRGGKGGD
jgi:hypothetical protein